MQSYYDILNVKSNSSKEEIKKQYKKLIKMYHPDINSSIEAEEIFKNITKASEVLLDDDKRKKYDLLRNANKKVNESRKNSSNYTFDNLFSKKNKTQKTDPIPMDGEDITVNITINYQEAVFGTTRIVNISTSKICPKCKGHKFANGQKCCYCDGRGETTLNKKITVKIPQSIKNKTKLRIKNEGKEGKNGGKNGNLYVVVNVEEEKKDFKIENKTVYSEAQISPYTAVLGGNVEVSTLWGNAVIKIPPLTKTNQSFKLIDAGIMDEKTHKKGEQIVKIIIQIPSDITDEELYLYEKLKEINQNKNAKNLS